MLNKYRYHILLAVLILVDQLSKYIAAQHIQIFRNYLFAFSLPVPQPLMYLFYIAILVAIGVYIFKRHHYFSVREKVAWTLILAGSTSNIGERIIAGYVKDFIYLFTGVFNVADFYIMLGIVLLLLLRD